VVLEPRLRAALRRINDHLPEDAIEQAVRAVMRPAEATLEQNNRWFHRLLTEGIDVEYRTADGETRGDKAWPVDFSGSSKNDLLVVNQFTVKCGNFTRRADLVVFLNGMPVAVMELKDPTDERADLWKAYRQLQDYKEHIAPRFVYNELLAVSGGDSTRVGSLTAGTDRFSPWRSVADSRKPAESRFGRRRIYDHSEVRETRAGQRTQQHRGAGGRGAPKPVRPAGQRRALDARRPAERHLHRLHRRAAGAR
jgi:type I restriction enzyme R subunit